MTSSALEIQQMLADERERSEQHRRNYLLLKEDNTRLHNEYLLLQEELKSVLTDWKDSKDLGRTAIEKASHVLQQKEIQLQELQQKLLLEGTEAQRVKLRNEMTVKLEQMDNEIEKLQSECNQLRHHNLMLSSQLDTLHVSRRTSLQEIQLKHQTELRFLRDSLESLRLKGSRDEDDNERHSQLAKESARLKASASELSSELEEVRAQKERLSKQLEEVKRANDRESERQQRTVRTLELERSSLANQRQELQKELHELRGQDRVIQEQLKNVLQEKMALKSSLDDHEYKSQMETTQMQMELQRLRAQLQGTQSELERAKVNAEDEAVEMAALKKEDRKLKNDLQRLQESLKMKIERQESLQKELSLLRSLAVEKSKEERGGAAAQQQPTELLKQELQELRKELEEKESSTLKGKQERFQMQGRLEELQKELREMHVGTAEETQLIQKKLNKYRKLIGKLRNKLQIMESQLEESRCQRELLKRNVPHEMHVKVKRQLRDLQTRHREFRRILAGDERTLESTAFERPDSVSNVSEV